MLGMKEVNPAVLSKLTAGEGESGREGFQYLMFRRNCFIQARYAPSNNDER
ncbi:hypothetical protein DFE_0337 [Desulfovibrio ferrophilus]|uniref:Uncharacterized protein n=1 Tax=Desulfovibrio ferrophilus TaxID=241368 RepID=A0A2Z6AV07_9BACT|nr:hypothetical protein DFE_0337 [Desulfovibrio ferrophilus]